MVKTIPDGIPPGSDAANLSVMGYNPRVYYTGRSPLEAASMGIDLSDTDVATMIDYSSDEISSEEAKELIYEINRHFALHGMEEPYWKRKSPIISLREKTLKYCWT